LNANEKQQRHEPVRKHNDAVEKGQINGQMLPDVAQAQAVPGAEREPYDVASAAGTTNIEKWEKDEALRQEAEHALAEREFAVFERLFLWGWEPEQVAQDLKIATQTVYTTQARISRKMAGYFDRRA
jgi:DNA-directed RNA polymerase specialized sigma subunit